MIGITIAGDDLTTLGEEALGEMRPAAEAVVLSGAQMIAAKARQLVGRGGAGRVLKRFIKTRRRKGRDIVTEQASAPGDPPALHEGDLQKSIIATRPKWKGNTVSAAAGPKGKSKGRDMAAVGSVLEFGDHVGKGHKAYIAPRPFMRPAEKLVEPAFEAMAQQVFDR